MFKGIFSGQLGSGGNLLTSSVENPNIGCDPLLGLLRCNWTTSGDMTGAVINIYVDGPGLTGYIQTGINPALGTIDIDMTSIPGWSPGFTSIDDYAVEIHLVRNTNELSGSPASYTPIYPCT